MSAKGDELVYTLGTSTRSPGEFIELLSSRGVEVVVDVRRFPSSRFEHFHKEKLAGYLSEAGINYIYMGEELGGYRRGGYQNFITTSEFRLGLRKLEEIAQEKRTAVVCAERFPWRCHRRFIALELEKQGWQVKHIIDREREWVPKKTIKGMPLFIGIDLSDPFAQHKRTCTRAILGAALHCTFDEWEYDLTGSTIVPPEVAHLPYIVAIDGHQGLSGSPERRMRLCEQQLRAAAKSPYDFPPIGQPYAGFVRGSVELFYSLYSSKNFHLYGVQKVPKSTANLIEVYPGSAWPVLAKYRLKKKSLLEGRRARYDLLVRRGLTFAEGYSTEMPPTHDQLDAAVAAYIAYLFKNGKTTDYGMNPSEDISVGILREGLIVQPGL